MRASRVGYDCHKIELSALSQRNHREISYQCVAIHKSWRSLRQLLKYELTAINQSFLHARMCLDWGYDSLAKRIRKDSIANMVFAEQLIDRILFLEGMPNLRDTYSVKVGIGHQRDAQP